jgi:hypothetical protein
MHDPSAVPRRGLSQAASRQWRACALALAVAASGCATQQVKEITLSGVARDGRPISGPAPAEAASLTRNGAVHQVAPDMVLQPGDTIQTGPDASVVVTYPGGARAYIFPDTRARIGSIFDEIGKVFVKVKGAFKVHTTYVTAASEGTEYWVDVGSGDMAKVVVVEGRVGVSSSTGAWPSRVLGPRQQVVVRGPAPPEQGPADPAEIRRQIDAVKRLDAAVPVKTTLSPLGAAIGIAVGIGVIKAIGDRNDRDDDPPSSETPGRSPGGTRTSGGTSDGPRGTGTPGTTGSGTAAPGTTAPSPPPVQTTVPPAASSGGTVPTQPPGRAILRRNAPIVRPPPPAPPSDGPVVK